MFWKPETLFEVFVAESTKVVVVLAMAALLAFGFKLALIRDKTNVKAQKTWTEEAKELDAKIEFQKAHPKVSF